MRVAIIQTYGMGNAILTTPTIKAIASLGDGKRHQVFVIADQQRKAAVQILKACPGVKKVLDKRNVEAIKKERLEMAVLCCDEPRLPGLYRIPRVETAFILRGHGEKHDLWYARWNEHEMDVIFRGARALGYVADMPTVHLPIKKNVPLTHSGPKVAMGIGYYKGDSRGKKKHWGNKKFAKLAQRAAGLNAVSFLFGDEHDKDDALEIVKLSGGAAVSLCGKFGLETALGVLSGCSAYVGNDTGITHAAAALGLPSLAVFKPWASSFTKNAPYGPKGSSACEWPGTDVSSAVWCWLSDELGKLRTKKKKRRRKR